MPNDNVTPLRPRTHAVRRALERYGSLHAARANPAAVQADLSGFISDMLVDLYHLADEENLSFITIVQGAHAQAIEEGASIE
jgi:hypothetical protein